MTPRKQYETIIKRFPSRKEAAKALECDLRTIRYKISGGRGVTRVDILAAERAWEIFSRESVA